MIWRLPSEPTPPSEDFEPYEEQRGIPMPVLWIAIALALWGALALYQSSRSNILAQDEREEALEEESKVVVDPAASLFEANCSTCHQSDGLGLRGAVPPLAGSEFVATGAETVARIMLRGIDGPLRVMNTDYNGHMPSFASALGDAEVAGIASFVAKRWGQDTLGIEEKMVAILRSEATDEGSFAGGEEIAGIVQGLPAQPASTAKSETAIDPDVTRLVFQGGDNVWACATCHGDLAQGKETTPRLAGLPARYIEKQLHDFSAGSRSDESMMLVAKSLTDEEIRGLATYFAGLRVDSTAQANLGGDLKRGEALALRGDWTLGVPACFTCHGAAGFGVAPAFPALAAQQAPYTATQLAAWAGGRRGNSPLGLMEQISKALTTADRRAVADYLATLAPIPAFNFNVSKQEMSNAGRTGEP